MTTFKEISGQLIRTLSSDPANPQEGQIWYNSTIGVLKGYDLTLAAWASGGNLATARYNLAGAGTQTAGLSFWWIYWSSCYKCQQKNIMDQFLDRWGKCRNTARRNLGGAGLQTAALAFGGATQPGDTPSSATEEYNGSTWTPGGTLGTARRYLGGCGTQTAGLGFWRYLPGVSCNWSKKNMMVLLGQGRKFINS
jgi:hypothetical protein